MIKENEWLKIFKQTLEGINDDYDYEVNWHTTIIKEQIQNGQSPRTLKSDNHVFITITKLPTMAYGTGNYNQQLQVSILCYQDKANDVYDVLEAYQNMRVNKKYWIASSTSDTEQALCNESWYSPSIAQDFINFTTRRGTMLTMNGSIYLSTETTDLKRIEIDGVQTKFLMFNETTTADSLPSVIVGNVSQKSINRSSAYRFDLKVLNTNTAFCRSCRDWKYGLLGLNVSFKFNFIYTDNTSYEKTMIINNVTFQTSDGTLPTIVVSMVEKTGAL